MIGDNDRQGDDVTDIRIGSLLALSGLVRATDLEEALVLAEETKLPVGRILVMSNRLSEETLRTVVDVQALIKDGALTREQALDAVNRARRSNRPLLEVLTDMGLHERSKPTNRLGELLIDCGQLTPEQLDRALEIGAATGLPIGRVLVLLGHISEPLMLRALQLQQEIRQGTKGRQAAITTIKMEKVKLQGLKSRDANKPFRIKLGELMVAAEILSKSDIEAALEMAEANNKMIGEILTDLNWVTEDLLFAALKLQQRIWQQELTIENGISILNEMYTTNASMEVVEQRRKAPTPAVPLFQKSMSIFEFLKVTGFMTRRRLTELIESCIGNPKLLSKILTHSGITSDYTPELLRRAIKAAITDSDVLRDILKETGVVEPEVVAAVDHLCELVKQGALPLDRAIVAFTYCHDMHIPVTEAIAALGWPVK